MVAERDGFAYFHFYQGLPSSAITFAETCSRTPRNAVLLNSGEALPIRHAPLPMKTDKNCVASHAYDSVACIPVDSYPAEPLVIRVEWN